MGPEERLNAAIHHQEVDRISCAPLIECYASRFAGIDNYDFFYDSQKAFTAYEKLKNAYPQWDIRRSIYFAHYGPYQNIIGLMKCKMPGIDLPNDYEYQMIEYEAMSRHDYNIILESGYKEYLMSFYQKAHGVTRDMIYEAEKLFLEIHKQEIQHAKSQNQAFLYGAHLFFPTSYFSAIRSFPEFVRDVYKTPHLLQEVLSIAIEESVLESIAICKETGVFRVMVGANRISSQFFSPAIFEGLIWPHLEKAVHMLIDHNITPVLHLDGDWSKNLQTLKKLPQHKVIVEFDGSTNMFLAKEIIGDKVCLLGDVPPGIFVLSSPEATKKYCLKLLQELSIGGGFILSSGCTLPYAAKHENVNAFFQALDEFNHGII